MRNAGLVAVVVGLAIVVPSVEVASQDAEIPPSFMNIASTVQVGSWLSMTCDPVGRAGQMTCHFQQVLVSAPTAEEVAERVARAGRTVEAMTRRTLDSMASDCERGEGGWSLEVCACFRAVSTRRTCVADIFRRDAEIEARACTMRTAAFDVTFDRMTPSRWMGTVRSVLCDMVTAVVLEVDGRARFTLTQTRLAVPDDDDPLCGGYHLGVTDSFSSDAPRLAPLTCTGIRSGY